MNEGSVMRISVVIIATIISCGALAACFHHRQAVVEYGPPPRFHSAIQITARPIAGIGPDFQSVLRCMQLAVLSPERSRSCQAMVTRDPLDGAI